MQHVESWLHALAALLAATFVTYGAAAAAVPELRSHLVSADVQRVELTDSLLYLEDPTGRLTQPQVDALARSGAMKHVAKPRIPMMRLDEDRAYWILMDVAASPTAPVDWILEIPRPWLERVKVFVKTGDSAWAAFPEVGAARPFSARPIDHRFFQFPVRLQPGATTLFLIRIQHLGPGTIQAALWQPAALQASHIGPFAFICAYFGLVAGMLLYNTLLYVSLKDRGYLFYMGCVTFTATAYLVQSGLGAQFIWGDWPWWNVRAMYLSFGGAVLFSATLTRHFLRTRERLPLADKGLRVVAGAAGIAGLSSLIIPNLAAMAMVPVQIASTIMVSTVSIVALVRRWPGAAYFCAAWAALYLGVFVLLVRLVVRLPDHVLIVNSMAVGSALEMVLLSLALADRINDEKRQKEQAQSLALGVLKASQAISSETRLDHLHARLREIVRALSGATAVRFILRDPDFDAWYLHGEGEGDGSQRMRLAEAVDRGLVPADALQWAQHAWDPRVMGEAWLGIPIVHHGSVSALLMLENRGMRGEFPPHARAALEGIAGPLAVSLENVLLYERLEHHVAARTRELRDTQQELVATARRAGMAEIATNVLHNVGNTLNSVNVAAELMGTRLAQSKVEGLARAVDLLESHRADLAAFFREDAKGRILPEYLRELAQVLEHEHKELQSHLHHLSSSVDHIKRVVATQQAYAGTSLLTVRVRPGDLVEDALRIADATHGNLSLDVVKEIAELPPVYLDKTRTLQILVNLLDNAKQAMAHPGVQERRLIVQVESEDTILRFRVRDSGCGIAPENLTRIFAHGYTTREGGHGFGLHSCALVAAEMGGELTARSDGLGRGATFTLELPLVPAEAESIAG